MAIRDIPGWTLIQPEDFQKEVLDTFNEIIVVEFFRDHCSACDMFEDTLAQIARKYGSVLRLLRIDTGWDNPWKERYDVVGQPTTSFFYNGKWYVSHSGASIFDYFEDIFLYNISLITKSNNLAPISKTMFDNTPVRHGPTGVNHLYPSDNALSYTNFTVKS